MSPAMQRYRDAAMKAGTLARTTIDATLGDRVRADDSWTWRKLDGPMARYRPMHHLSIARRTTVDATLADRIRADGGRCLVCDHIRPMHIALDGSCIDIGPDGWPCHCTAYTKVAL